MSAFRDKKKSRTRRGQAVTVYDGRNWPVVKCGAVYLSDEDKTKHVTKKIVQQATSSSDKKKKSSKYTLAIGSSFGHVHAFLNDSDNVLSALESTQAEDKCLMLIRKPKSASKQMLKAHSWANLHEPDESIFKGFNSSLTRNKGKLSSRELTLLPDGSTATRWHQLPISLPQTELPAVSETDDESRSEVLSRESEDTLDSLSNSYPHRTTGKHFLNSREKSRSSCDINFRNYEINNNRPGIGNARPLAAPPEVPSRNVKSSEVRPSPPRKSDKLDDKNNNRNGQSKLSGTSHQSWTRGESSLSVFKPQSKSDTNFFGGHALANDQLYDADGVTHYKTNKSSSNSLTAKASDGRKRTENEKYSGHRQKCDTVPKTSSNSSNSGNKSERSGSLGHTDQRSTATESLHVVQKQHSTMLEAQSCSGSRHRYGSSNPSIPNMTQSMYEGGYYSKTGSKPGSELHSSASTNQIDRRPRSYSQHDSLSSASVREPACHEKSHTTKDNRHQTKNSEGVDESVVRSKSLGDISADLGFSVARSTDPVAPPKDAYRKEQAPQAQRSQNGHQQAPHFQIDKQGSKVNGVKVRQPQQKHDSLPVRVKGSGDNSDACTMDQIARRFEKLPLQATIQYGSLQQLNSNMEAQQRHLASSKYREKTPIKPRRTLPQVPGDVDERIKHYGDLVKMRVSLSSRESGASSGSQGSNQNGGNDLSRHARPCETPSDREVSELLEGRGPDSKWETSPPVDQCHGFNVKHDSRLHPDRLYEQPLLENQSLRSSDSFGSHDHNLSLFSNLPSGGRLSETGQTTLTSQSTIDSGYTTNDPEQDMPSSSNYALSLKQSAQSMYMSNKLLKSSSSALQKSKSPLKDKDMKTQSWVEQHPVFSQVKLEKIHSSEKYSKPKIDSKPGPVKSNNSIPEVGPPSYNEHLSNQSHPDQQYRVSEKNAGVDRTEKSSVCHASDSQVLSVQKRDSSRKAPNHSHRLSDLSVQDLEKVQGLSSSQNGKGKSVSMSYGLNLIEPNLSQQNAKHVSKSQPRFTGSLLNLAPVGNSLQQVPDRSRHSQVFGSQQNISGTLPGGWKPNARGLESSLKMMGKPSLFQLLQSYHLYPVRIQIPGNFSILDNMRLVECEVVLPSPWSNNKDATSVTSPKGSYAKLGGPGSAFKPVVSGSSGIGAVSMVTIVDLSPEVMGKFVSGQINKGDLIVEVNEQLMMGEELATLKSLLQACHQGELLLTIARDKARDSVQRQNSSSSDTDAARKMEEKILHLKSELRKKDRTLEQLNALLPWKQSEENGGSKDANQRDSYICSLSEDEFIV